MKKRTLTSLYNQRPTRLDLAHKKLDVAIFAAYGWPERPGELSDEVVLERLLALNLARAAKKARTPPPAPGSFSGVSRVVKAPGAVGERLRRTWP